MKTARLSSGPIFILKDGRYQARTGKPMFPLPSNSLFPTDQDDDQRHQRNYENDVVQRIIDSCDVGDLEWEMRDAMDREGRIAIRLLAKHFSMCLCTKHFPREHQIRFVDLCRLTSTPIYEAYMTAIRNAPADLKHLPLGLVFPCNGAEFLILHSHEPAVNSECPVMTVRIRRQDQPMFIQLFDDFLAGAD